VDALKKIKYIVADDSPFVYFKPDIDLSVIQRSFDEIPIDPHFEPGYRYRTQSLYEIMEDGQFKILHSKPLYQPTYINSYNNYGGKTREYDNLPTWLIDDSNFNALVNAWIDTLPGDIDRFSAHQIRTVSDGGEVVPEGRHRDGYDYIGVFIVNRKNITDDCAISIVWVGDTDHELFNGVVEPGTLLSFDDKLLMHNVGSIKAKDGRKDCLRDVIIFTVPECCIG